MELGVSMFGDNHFNENGKPQSPGVRLRKLLKK